MHVNHRRDIPVTDVPIGGILNMAFRLVREPQVYRGLKIGIIKRGISDIARPISSPIWVTLKRVMDRRLLALDNAPASRNIKAILVIEDVSQSLINWLKEDAPLNIWLMIVTSKVSQLPMGWLKDWAPLNILLILVTAETFQSPIGWLNEEASLNIEPMIVTAETFQSPIGWLNEDAPLKVLHHCLNGGYIPITNRLVERRGIHKHMPHVGDSCMYSNRLSVD